MNYKRIHDIIIERAKTRIKPNGYTEDHHIIPRCMGGTEDKSNFVTLTAREHFIIHLLLIRIYPDNKGLVYAAFRMSVPNSQQGIKINSILYESLKIQFGNIVRKNATGNTWMKGRKHTEESKKLMSLSQSGKKVSKETRELISKSMNGNKYGKGNKNRLGHYHSEETKKLMSEARIGNKNACGNRGKPRKPFTEEHKRNLSLAQIKRHAKKLEFAS